MTSLPMKLFHLDVKKKKRQFGNEVHFIHNILSSIVIVNVIKAININLISNVKLVQHFLSWSAIIIHFSDFRAHTY